ncbi:MAG: ComEC/Rec2 family competence protein [Alphaproteobacteria bacterium]|nr:ComEC/Rec2 family competence protein [Alphaproteobacteria bacterium]
MDRWTRVGLGVIAGAALGSTPGLGLASLVGSACAVLALRLMGLAPVVTELALGVLLGLAAPASVPLGPHLRGPASLVGVVVGAPMGREIDLEVGRAWRPGVGWRHQRGRVRVRLPRSLRVGPGDEVVAFGVAGPVQATVLPGAPDPVRAARRVGVRSLLRATVARRVGATSAPVPEVHGLLLALADGDRRRVAPEAVTLLRRTGTAHLLAISGFHVGLVATAGMALCRWPLRAVAGWWPAGVRTWPALLAGVCGAAVFAARVGLPVSAQRAVGLVALVALGVATGRHLVGASLLAVVATGVLVADPAAVAGPSFQLSFGAVAGLLTWGKALDRRLPPDLPWWTRPVTGGLVATCAATVGTLPAAAWWFQSVALWGPLANVLAVPWTALALVPPALAAVHGPALLAAPAAVVGAWSAEGLLAVLAWFDAPPLRPAVGPWGAVALLGVLGLARRPWHALLLVAGVLWARPLGPPAPRITWPDVGQGSAALAVWPDGRTVLVDGGPPWSGLASWLRRQGRTRLDTVVLSHGDADHLGGLLEVVEEFDVGELRVAGGPAELLEVARRRGIPVVDDPQARLHPGDPGPWRRPNDASLVEALEVGGWRVLLPGDIGREVEAGLARRVGEVDLLALAHHGSSSSTSAAWLDVLRPRLAVVQAGRGNPYGHPGHDVLRRLADRGVPVLRTDLLGTVELTLGDPPTLRCHRAGQGWRAVPLPVHGVPATATPPPRAPRRPPRSPATSRSSAPAAPRGRSRARRRRGRPP